MSLENFNSQSDWNLTEEEWDHIEEGIDDAENGRVLSSEQFWDLLKNG